MADRKRMAEHRDHEDKVLGVMGIGELLRPINIAARMPGHYATITVRLALERLMDAGFVEMVDPGSNTTSPTFKKIRDRAVIQKLDRPDVRQHIVEGVTMHGDPRQACSVSLPREPWDTEADHAVT